MAQLHQFTLRAASRMLEGQRVTKGHRITLPVGSSLVQALRNDPAWDHTMVPAVEARRENRATTTAPQTMEVPRRAQAAYTGLANRLQASVQDLEGMKPAERDGVAFLVRGNREHLVRFLTALGLADLFAEQAAAPSEDAPGDSQPPQEDEEIPPASDEDAAPPPAPPDPKAPTDLEAMIQDEAVKFAQKRADAERVAELQANADRQAARQALKEKLVTPGSSTMAHLVKLARLAALEVPEDLAKSKDRASLIAGLAGLLAATLAPSAPALAPATASAARVDPSDLG